MSRSVVIWVLVLPLAILLGFMLATPTDTTSFGTILMCFGVLLVPVLLRQHHFLLTLTWNSSLIVFFLPGQPSVVFLVALVSFAAAVIERTMRRNKEFMALPSVTLPLVLLAVVILITAKLTGGIGGRVFGSELWGARRYFGVFGALIGFLALVSQRIPKHKAGAYTAAFFLGGTTSVISDLIYMAGPQFYFLFVLFPSDYAGMQAQTADTLMRLGGVAFASAAAYYYLLSRFGIAQLFSPSRLWALVLLGLMLGGSMLGGYRGLVILLILVMVAQFFVEGVYRTKLGPILILACLPIFGFTAAFVDRMPLSVQRAFSFLPLENISPTARSDALGTLDWRLSMWRVLIPEIPKYLILGKGYSFNGTDYYLTEEAVRRGMYASYEDILISGNYHNGILTVLIPFGIFGFGAFLWFCAAAFRVLRNNLRYGDPDLRLANTFLLSYFLARFVFYIVFYGQFDSDLMHFTGTLGLSIALNGGMRTRADLRAEEAVEEPAFEPMARAVAL
jgi:hypothetical protein